MKKFFSKSLIKTSTGNNDIAKNELYANRDYYCEGQEIRIEASEKSANVEHDVSGAEVKVKKQKFTACYNMFF